MSESDCSRAVLNAFENATKTRAKAYAYIYEELLGTVGEKKADKIFSKAIYRLGIDKSKKFPANAKKSAKEVADYFIKDPVSRAAFKQSVVSGDEKSARIQMKSCYLVKMWKEMGLSDARILKLCDLAYQVDFGKIESLGYHLEFSSRIADKGKACVLEITKK
jgi:hypothetical protein